MSFTEYQSKNNTMFVLSGFAKSKDSLKREKKYEHYNELSRYGSFAGVELKHFLSDKERLSLLGEERFKSLLDQEKIPFLYVGQGPFGVERSGVLLDDTRSKRPDFIAHVPAIGSLLFDVKCRQKISFLNKSESFFYIFTSEITALAKLQATLKMPLWLAFIDRNGLAENPFHLVPIIAIECFLKELKAELRRNSGNNTKEQRKLKAIRIPSDLFCSTENGISFPHLENVLSSDLISALAKDYEDLHAFAEDKIERYVEKKKPLEKQLQNYFVEKLRGSLFKAELNHILAEMLRNGQLKVNKEGRYLLR